MAKNDEVAHSFQSLMGAHGGQVADPVIEAMKALSFRTFWSNDGRRVSLRYLSAVGRYTTLYRVWHDQPLVPLQPALNPEHGSEAW